MMTSANPSKRWLWGSLAVALILSAVAVFLPKEDDVVTAVRPASSASIATHNAIGDRASAKASRPALTALRPRNFTIPEDGVFVIAPSGLPPERTNTPRAPPSSPAPKPVASPLPPVPPPITNPWKLAGLYSEGDKQFFILSRANPSLEKVVAPGEALDDLWLFKSATVEALTLTHKPNGQSFSVPITAK